MWKESNNDNIKNKDYKKLLSKKKVDVMVSRREELIFLGKNNPKLFWKELQPRNIQIGNSITTSKWFDYARQLYERLTLPPWSTLILNSSHARSRDGYQEVGCW